MHGLVANNHFNHHKHDRCRTAILKAYRNSILVAALEFNTRNLDDEHLHTHIRLA